MVNDFVTRSCRPNRLLADRRRLRWAPRVQLFSDGDWVVWTWTYNENLTQAALSSYTRLTKPSIDHNTYFFISHISLVLPFALLFCTNLSPDLLLAAAVFLCSCFPVLTLLVADLSPACSSGFPAGSCVRAATWRVRAVLQRVRAVFRRVRGDLFVWFLRSSDSQWRILNCFNFFYFFFCNLLDCIFFFFASFSLGKVSGTLSKLFYCIFVSSPTL